jgi:outer membrane protein assembly factor BamB
MGFVLKINRMLCLMIAVFILCAEALPASSQDKNAKADWSIFRGNPRLTGVVPGHFPDQPDLLWTFAAEDEIVSAATMAGQAVFFGSIDGYLYALDLNSGKLKWKYKATDEIQSSPSVSKNVVYFGDQMGVFHAVNAKSGKKKWTFETDAEIISSANFFKDRVIFGSYDQFLYCLSAKDGSLIWKFETEQYVHATPALYKRDVMISGCDGFFRVIDVDTGKEKHNVYLGSQAAASAAILDDRAYLGTFGNQVLCIDLKDPGICWEYEHPRRHFPFYASAAVTKELVLVAGRDKMLHALNPETGEALWIFSARSKIDSSPIIAGDRAFFAAMSGEIYALSLATGETLWEYDTGSGIEASPSMAAGKLVIGSLDGVLYCFGEKK